MMSIGIGIAYLAFVTILFILWWDITDDDDFDDKV